MGDIYHAARYYLYVIENWPDQTQAYINLVKCFTSLKWFNEAQSWLDFFRSVHPENSRTPQVSFCVSCMQTIARLS